MPMIIQPRGVILCSNSCSLLSNQFTLYYHYSTKILIIFILNNLLQGEFILVEDNQTDGNFILHHFISLFIKGMFVQQSYYVRG